ncbi:Transferase family [Trichophyton interdigitale]|nr:Transferase family [Trichophyton interdigitale]KAG5217577.1 Transferase family [Trichophyton interdigitale]KAG8206050.1 Transferase family [Trichophyton interdigitale]
MPHKAEPEVVTSNSVYAVDDKMSTNSLKTNNDDIRKTSRLILDIIFEYALNKFDDSKDRLEAGADHFLDVIDRFVAERKRVDSCLPAFPFKSANKVYKVLGILPDMAEQLALERLNTMCARIRDIYPPGAQVTIISDGITYNDLLSISDQDTWAYGEALRKMAIDKKFIYIQFSRMKDLLDFPLPGKLTEITYVANCTTFRRLLINRYGRDDLDIDQEITTNPDTKLTYLGYKRFLESDLKHIFPRGVGRSAHSYKRDCKYLAKQMLMRGYAFAGAVKNAFPNYLRLSIHESVGLNKVSVCLLNTKTGFTTPWHCAVCQLADGEWVSAPMGEFAKDSRLEVVYVDGRPSHYREKLRENGVSAITESTASYLQAARPVNAAGYLSGASTPGTASPSSFSASPPRTTVRSSGGTTPESESPPTLHKSGLGVVLGNDMDNLNVPKQSNVLPSVPYGMRLIPQIMDELAVSQPERVVFSLATLSGTDLVFKEITACAFNKAVDKTAWWLRSQVGIPESVQPVGYIGPHDLRHVLLTYACVKAGYAALFLSPKNSTLGAVSVLETTNCNIWVSASEVAPEPLVEDILRDRPMKLLQLPLLEELLDSESTEAFPFSKNFEEAINEPFCYLHTSGSTGVPKPIPWSHGLIGTMDAVRLLPPAAGFDGLLPWTSDWLDGDTIYSSFPMCHGAGIIMNILMPAFFNLHCVLGLAGALPNIRLVETLADNFKIDIWSMVPSLVNELGETPEVLAKLKPSKFICASGGPVSPISAGKVNDVVRVLNLTGTTEGLFIGNLVTPREDWFWFCFHPYSGFEFKEIGEDTYEHWIHRNEHWPLFQGIYHTFPEKESINFKDLYMKHPSKPNLWAFKGRSDDLVVLSNGYKITPLETESLVSTHPAIKGCILFGTGKPQAGLLIDLKDPSQKSEELLDSIWETVKKANSMSRHKDQLLKDFVTFTKPDKPFIYTDKGTVKRAATLALYNNYIDRFYSSLSDDPDEMDAVFPINMESTDAIEKGVREILASSVQEIQQAPVDTDLFELGLDSLGVFAAIKKIRMATGLGESIAPRHVYANPTLARLSSTIAQLAEEAKAASTAGPLSLPMDDERAKLKRMIAHHQSRQSFKLNALDYVNPNHNMGLVFYFSLRDGVSYEEVFNNLQEGLNRTFDLIPALSGKIMHCSEQEIGYKKGDLCVTIPPLSMATSAGNRLVYKDLSGILPSFDKLRQADFAPSLFKDSLVLRDDPITKIPADIFAGQVNFVEGGCIVAVDLNHCCLDGLGAMIALKVWAENCRFLQGDKTATCSWYDPESFNHSLPEILHEQEGWTRPVDEVDPGTWGFLPFFPPDDSPTNRESPLGPRPVFPLHNVWPLPRAERCMKTTSFLITPEKLEKMKQDVIADPEAKGVITSISDIVQAFFWRTAIRARYRVAKEIRKQTFGPDEMSILELPTDGRPYFSTSLPSTYMGSVLIMNRCSIPVETLCSPDTSIGYVAYMLRQSTARITPSLVHDAFTILQSLPDHSRFSTANMGLEHMHAMISNMMLFPTSEISFGSKFFANGGCPESMRPQVDRANGIFRFLAIYPMKKDGGVELVLGTHAEELEMFKTDPEFTKYADLVDVC